MDTDAKSEGANRGASHVIELLSFKPAQ
jgi:hypothetical protein